MTTNGPKRTDAARIGAIGEHLVQTHLLKFAVCNQLVADFGIDLLCQLVNDGRLGRPFFVQIKTARSITSESYSIRIKRSTASYWATLPIPVLLIVCVLEPNPRFLWRDAFVEIGKVGGLRVGEGSPSDITLRFRQDEFADETVLGGIAEALPAMATASHARATQTEITWPEWNIWSPWVEESRLVTVDKVPGGSAVRGVGPNWVRFVEQIYRDHKAMFGLKPQEWEEVVAGAFHLFGWDVVITPRAGDFGRDLIVTKSGIGLIRTIVSVKAYAAGNLVRYDDVRALLGVLHGERDASKAVLVTTSDFPSRITKDPFIGPYLPYRLELMNGEALREWLIALRSQKGDASSVEAAK